MKAINNRFNIIYITIIIIITILLAYIGIKYINIKKNNDNIKRNYRKRR